MSTSEWDDLSDWEQMMYVEGLRQEGIIKSADEVEDDQPTTPQRPEFGKPVEMGPQKVDMSRLGQRTVNLQSVNWGPPE